MSKAEAQIAAVRAILDPILDPVSPEATDEDLADAMFAIVAIVYPERAIYAPGRRRLRP